MALVSWQSEVAVSGPQKGGAASLPLCPHLQGEGLGEVDPDAAVVLPQHAEHAARHAPQTLVLLGLSLNDGRGEMPLENVSHTSQSKSAVSSSHHQ